jgi:EAL domain-containing protein (putative c-di-GMP-specific phosphodiesterase class I)/GGDEF domain-containing protein
MAHGLWSSVPICNAACLQLLFAAPLRQGRKMGAMQMAQDRDSLTGLIGPQAARAQISGWRDSARARGEQPCVHAMLLGLKRFAAVNLAYGEDAGDRALAEIAARVLHFAGGALDNEWLVARIGGGNFLLAANEPCSRERWQWLAEELAQVVSAPIPDSSGGTVRVWPRIALLRALPREGAGRMLGRLAETLDAAQQHQGRRLQWVDGEMTLPGRPAQQLEADLLAALDRNEIEMLFQPQYACDGGELVGAEALARWQHPQLGRIGAGALFAIAERADHVEQLSRHIAGAALKSAAGWPDRLRLSLNITAADLAAGSFANSIAEAIAKAGFSPDRLTLEITEQSLVSEVERSGERLRQLADLGIRIALDDFGAGFCNFRYLKLLPLHYLKLDRSMVEGVADSARDLAVLRAITAMAQALDLRVIAEGIESEDQRHVVAAEGCHAWQGYLGAKPMSAAQFTLLVA